MRVMIYEPSFRGHSFVYLNRLIPELLGMGCEVALETSGAALTSREFRTLIEPLATSRLTVRGELPSDPPRMGVSGCLASAGQVAAAVARSKPDHVMIMYADGVAQGLTGRAAQGRRPIPSGVTSEGLFFRGEFLYPAATARARVHNLVKWGVARRAPLTFFHHLDPVVYEWEQSRARSDAAFHRRWSLMPDPVDPPRRLERREARELFGLPPAGGRVVGCAGALDRRKGIDLLLEAFARAPLAREDVLFLAGPQVPEIKALIADRYAGLVRDGRLVCVDRVLTPAELADSLCAMDLVCTPYPRHIGSASIVIRAAATPRPVLAADFGWLERTVGRFNLGRTCRVEDPDAFARAMTESVESAGSWSPGEAARRFVAFHDSGNFALCATARVRELLGRPAPAAHRTWDWVQEALGATPHPPPALAAAG